MGIPEVSEPLKRRIHAMGISEIPDFSGRAGTDASQSKGLGYRPKPLVLAWVVVCALNLILPLQLGWMLTYNAGRLGMLFAVVLLLALGCRISFVSRKVGIALVGGGLVVAISQPFPPVYIIPGAIGMAVAQALGQATKHGPAVLVDSEMGGFVATILTGSILMIVAMSIGLSIQMLRTLIYRKSADYSKYRNK